MLLTRSTDLRSQQTPYQNLRRYFAVQYTRSHVSVHCTIPGHPRL